MYLRLLIAFAVFFFLPSGTAEAQLFKKRKIKEAAITVQEEQEELLVYKRFDPDNPDDLGDDDMNYDGSDPPTLDLNKKKEDKEVKRKTKKKKKRFYYGIKTKKGWTKTGAGKNQVIEIFSVIKKYVEPDPYVKDFYWYNTSKKRIESTRLVKDTKTAKVLHGHYRKEVGLGMNKTIVEEGYYYKGHKHGRWMVHDRNDVLKDKVPYHKGHYRESEITWWDVERTKVKEIVPVLYGEKVGEYFSFYENGLVAEMGKYDRDVKVGTWLEYYPVRNKRKREIQYPDDCYEAQRDPHILREWDEGGKLTTENDALKKEPEAPKRKLGAPVRRY